jgi:hypothetical protein
MRKNRIILLLIAAFFIATACKSTTDDTGTNVKEPEFSENTDDPNLPLEERAKRQAILKLGIPANENFQIKIYQAYLNDDNMADAIITVNRLEYAKQRIQNLKNFELLNRDGIVGNYNYIIVYDGATNQISIPVPIPSSAKYALEVDFEYLFSDSYSTPVITYRIKDGQFKNFYAISTDGIMDKVFKMKSYEYVGLPKEEAYFYEIQEKGSFSKAKDIKVFKGKIENSKEISQNWFGEKAKITKTNQLDKIWYYDASRKAYVTPE